MWMREKDIKTGLKETKWQKNNNYSPVTGSIENKDVNEKIVEVLEGAMPAFNKRKDKYYE